MAETADETQNIFSAFPLFQFHQEAVSVLPESKAFIKRIGFFHFIFEWRIFMNIRHEPGSDIQRKL